MLPRRSLLALAAAIALLPAACKSAPPADPVAMRARAIAAADVRLRGAWLLENFTPDAPLEPMLAAMLAAQFGRMVVQFDGRNAVADSGRLHIERTYQITDSQGDQLQLVLVDEQGVSYPGAGLFVGNDELRFRSATPRWSGTGTLRRTVVPATTVTQVQ